MQTSISPFNKVLEKADIWLKELGQFANEEQAYSALRSVLRALRDRLVSDEATHLGAQLPTLIRGIYYEGFDIKSPTKEQYLNEFAERVSEELRNANFKIDVSDTISAVFHLLDKKISSGQINHLKQMLPATIIQRFWS